MTRRTTLLLPSALVLLVLGGLAWWSFQGGDRERAPTEADAAASARHSGDTPRAPVELARGASETAAPLPTPERATPTGPEAVDGHATRSAAAPPQRLEVHGRTRSAESGTPVAGVRLQFFAGGRLIGETVSELRTEVFGQFEVELVLDAGASCTVRAGAGWQLVHEARPGTVARERELAPEELSGAIPLEIAVEPFTPEPGTTFDVRGELVSERGPWTAETLPRAGAVLLDLARKHDPSDTRRALMRQELDEQGTARLFFELAGVPNGEWRLTLSALDGYRWHPPTVEIAGATDRLTFLRYDKDATVPLAFEVVDGATGEAIAAYTVRHLQTSVSQDAGVFLHTGPFDLERFPVQGAFAWSLWAEGHAPAFGDETSFELRGERRVARVVLQAGWSTKLFALARDPLARPLAGAEVYVDERFAGATRSDGTLVLRAAQRPAKIEVRAAGLRLATNPLEPYGGRSAEQRGHVSLAFLEPVR